MLSLSVLRINEGKQTSLKNNMEMPSAEEGVNLNWYVDFGSGEQIRDVRQPNCEYFWPFIG